MCDQRAWELLDVDQYFMKYIRISPILTYAEDDLNSKKLDLQTILLTKLESKEIDEDRLKKIYKTYIDTDNELSINLSALEAHYNEKINRAKQEKENAMVRFLELTISELSD